MAIKAATASITFSSFCSAVQRGARHLNSVDTDADRTIRWLITLMALCCDPRRCGDIGEAINHRLVCGTLY
jgi:hypothetical protein